jgi:hypothetical protein
MGILTWVLVAITFLAIVGLGWDTFFEGVKKGADRVAASYFSSNSFHVCHNGNILPMLT